MSHDQFEAGGPLAGLKLPLFPTQHGEEPGHSGCFPGTKYFQPKQHPEHELYPGSVEHWRVSRPNFFPNRPFFDQQSQLKNWVAPDLPGAGEEHVGEYAAPVYWPQEWMLEHYVAPAIPNEPGEGRDRAAAESLNHLPVKTDRCLRPVPVIRCGPDSPVISLDLGELDVGLYVVRLIGAVETEEVLPFRKSLFLKATVNDGPVGEPSDYRLRLGYCDEFYDVADVYFRAEVRRQYQMALQVDHGSEVELLVHNISLDDALAGCERRAIKARSIELPPENAPSIPRGPGSEARLARDAEIWRGFPRLNFQGGRFPSGGPDGTPGVEPGAGDRTPAEIEEEHGAWRHSNELGTLLVNEELGLRYTVDDLNGNLPLPEPYPLKDDGTGLVFPSEKGSHLGRVWAPIGEAVLARLGTYFRDLQTGAEAWVREGDPDQARDGALKLIRFAYSFPAMEDVNTLSAAVHDPSAYGRGDRCRRRETGGAQFGGHFGLHFSLAGAYDRLFTHIRDNEELAQSVGRFVPWVKSSADLIELLDVYLIQTLAKRFMRYHYWGDGRQPAYLAEVAAILGDSSVTAPWMEWLFNRTFYYPRPLAGLPDLMVTANDRDGRGTIASSSYVFGAYTPAVIAETLDLYIKNGGDPGYALGDVKRFPKIITSLHFPNRTRTAGPWTMRMGNVCGPDKGYAKSFEALLGEHAFRAWRWTHDPGFAFILKHYGIEDACPADELPEIEAAAAEVKRAPWMDNRSRVLPGHAAFLETGLQHDDFRFRRSVMLRVGTGTGHSHQDTLDMQIHAHGLPATIDAGQRPGYSVPGDKVTRVHNTVEVNGKDWLSDHAAENNQRDHVGGTNSWVRTLSDLEGARYLCAQVPTNALIDSARRQVALIDVDEGSGSVPLGPEAYGPSPVSLPAGVVTANSYVFDVFRVAGGHTHTYCFHSHVADPEPDCPQPKTNALDLWRLAEGRPKAERDQIAAAYLDEFSGDRCCGTAPENFEATFPLQKERRQEEARAGRFGLAGTESYFLRSAYDPGAPDKFTKLHVLGVGNELVMCGDLNCVRWDYQIPNVFVQRRGENLESAFAAIIEPYAGQPFIASAERLPIEDNEEDALQAVAVQVKTVNGHSDLCFADGRPEKTRQVSSLWVAAEYAFYSVDVEGLRQISLAGGSLIEGPEVLIRTETPERRATIVEVDYATNAIWIDQVWPSSDREQFLEVITQPAGDP